MMGGMDGKRGTGGRPMGDWLKNETNFRLPPQLDVGFVGVS